MTGSSDEATGRQLRIFKIKQAEIKQAQTIQVLLSRSNEKVKNKVQGNVYEYEIICDIHGRREDSEVFFSDYFIFHFGAINSLKGIVSGSVRIISNPAQDQNSQHFFILEASLVDNTLKIFADIDPFEVENPKIG